MIERYVKLPVDVLAIQFDGKNGDEIVDWINTHPGVSAHLVPDPVDVGTNQAVHAMIALPGGGRYGTPAVIITSPQGQWIAERGDWVVREIYGVFVVVDPEIFNEDYAPSEDPFEDECREVTLPSGEVMRMRGEEEMTPAEAAALGEIVEITRQLASDPERMAAFQAYIEDRRAAKTGDVHALPLVVEELRRVEDLTGDQLILSCPRCEATVIRLPEYNPLISNREQVEAAIAQHVAEQRALYNLAHGVRQRDGDATP